MRYDATQKYHEFLKAITQHSADGIMAFSESGTIILANAAVSSILGYDNGEMEGLNIQCILGSDHVDGPTLCRLFDQFEPDGDHMPPLTLKACQKGGGEIPIEIAVGNAVLTDGEKVYVASCRDITERLQIEGQLKSQAEVIRQMSDGMIVSDSNFQITECNHAIAKMLGVKSSELLGRAVYDFIQLETPDLIDREEIRQIAMAEGRWNGIVDFINVRGEKIKADVAVFPINAAFGEATVFASVIRDVTERVEAEERINQTQKIEALGRLAGGVAHDINNLLFPIFLNLEAALGDLQGREDLGGVCEDLKDSMEACLKIKTMVQNILMFSRKNSMDLQQIDVSEETREAWKLAKLIVPSSVECSVEIEPECGLFQGNSVQFSQIMLNLVSNAVSALDNGIGRLEVRLKPVNGGTIPGPKYYKLRQDEAVELSIRDTGCGISSTHVDKIFDPFYTTKGVGEGTGLGLTEVAGIVKSLNGAIDVSTCPGEGTEFKIYLPVTRQKAVQNA
ncbi:MULTISPECIES: PAS domain-containing sensor histidine kinase [Kordiimonas]|jgi:PAS domain S-box-containing protein|uniref:PAS domain-containing sensor histidine kinase n=1 Tax=Kordiimonas TaxID=288021 RepID=UPI00257EA362|nr:PAS domain-containing sensor histidine kinase [Kordiimonas sp. UBA4487]